MRLINTTTFELKDFFDAIPHYAILSHRWEDGEVSFQDFQKGRGPSMKGWGKISGCCQQAKIDGWNWAWVDSCCIDKSSSAELSEAINSMFAWYKRAEICYAYLSDVSNASPIIEAEFSSSKWFGRGWTLQELLAPRWIQFYNVKWKKIGTKSSLARIITNRTGIDENFLFDYTTACVAQKMFWASKRETTRVEDEAYCLMGLFDINMPLLYGEDSKAFLRLQLEILKQTNDDSLFAWEVGEDVEFGLLAPSPRYFESSGLVRRWNCDEARPPIIVTNKGLQLEVFLTKPRKDDARVLDGTRKFLGSHRARCVILNCRMSGSDDFIRLALNVPYPYWGSESYNGSTGWSRRGYLEINKVAPESTTLSTRFLLFAEAFFAQILQDQAPKALRIELPIDFAYDLLSSHRQPGFSLVTSRGKWDDKTPAPHVHRQFGGDEAIVFFFERLSHYTVPGSDVRSHRFGVVVVARPLSVEILDLDTVQLIKERCGSVVYYIKSKRDPGDSTSIKLADGSMLYAAHKKAFLDGEYSYVITVDASGLTDSRASAISGSRWLPFR